MVARYDAFADEYERLIRAGQPVIELSYRWILDSLGEIKNQRILDVGAGEGELARRLAERGALVLALDVSPVLVDKARARDPLGRVSWQVDDATVLATVGAGVDVVVMSLMLMDLDDYGAVFDQAYDALQPGGQAIWTVMHPCFQSPYSAASPDGRGRHIVTYAPQHWVSDRPGTIRGTLGAWHRPLADYLNRFVQAGFRIDKVAEPLVPEDWPLPPGAEGHRVIPALLGVLGSRPHEGR